MSGEETVDVAAIRASCPVCGERYLRRHDCKGHQPEELRDFLDRAALLDALDVRTRERDEARAARCDARPFADGDGDMRCQDCGHANPIWHARNALWNLVMGGPGAPDDPGGVVCPPCFIRRAEAVGLGPFWRVELAEADPGQAYTDAIAERDSARQERDEARDTLARVTKTAEHAIHVHAQVVMDTPEDRDLHDRAVQALRDHLRAALGDGRGQG